ncbi:response regulator [Aeromonas simiae]|uniref:response regulator n=1 Tax=Aeromonas simiae TaxID=218936 RepID=UPI0005A98573|nr:response regulator [Aeromonas simiae]MDO2948099.1 response regulator [Aeromonas simiae]MDO2952839.1 response regulator [Aeromonas simiae]MDO2955482.1 response regulator [Aeromonas simiae]
MEPITTLIIEDDVRIGGILSELILTTPGFQLVGCAPSLADAQARLECEQPRLLLVDVSLPDGSGLEWVASLRARAIETLVIMVTAASDVESIQRALHLGVQDYIIKPLRLSRIQQSLGEVQALCRRLAGAGHLEQGDLDRLLGKGRSREGRETPKGIDALTLRQVLDLLASEREQCFSTDTLALRLSLSRTTARRYLEYLESEDHLVVELSYGQRGRPERLYRWRGEA